MPRPKYVQQFNGQSIYQEDIAVLANAAGAGDDALKHLATGNARIGRSRVQRGLLRTEPGAIIKTGATGIQNLPFTVWIGAETTDPDEGWSGMRSVTVPGEAFTFPVPAIVGGRRIDLIVAKYSPRLASGTEPRKVKDPVTGVISEPNVSVTEYDAVTFEYLQGPDGVLPTWPNDPVGGFYVPIAALYITEGWAGAGTFPTHLIEEIADVRSPNMNPRPPTSSSSVVGGVFGGGRSLNFGSSNFGLVRETCMPSTMRGGIDLLVPIVMTSTVTAKLIDDSVDWRNRLFRSDVEYRGGVGTAPKFPWEFEYTGASRARMYAGFETDPTYDADLLIQQHHGQSFQKVGTEDLRFATLINSDSYLYVDDGGALRLTIGSTGNQSVLVWMQASAQYTFPGYF